MNSINVRRLRFVLIAHDRNFTMINAYDNPFAKWRESLRARRAFLKAGAVAAMGMMLPPVVTAAATSRKQTATPTLRDYEFITPHQWQVRNAPEYLLLTQTPDEQGCIIQILPPQPASGNLEQDAKAVFEMMYPDWNYSRTGAQQFLLAKGLLPSGHEYCMKEATMNLTTPDNRYLLEDGVALVVKAGDQVAIIAVRHRGLSAHADCLNKYETWQRFFRSFTIKGIPPSKARDNNGSTRIIGAWKLSSHGVASGEYVFAANGHYGFSGALGQSWTTTDTSYEYLHKRTYSFQGDGRYTIAGDKLTLTRHRGGAAEHARFRFEQVNHGGTGWKDRLYLLKQDVAGQFEVGYEKR